jgi:hypothetical protein
MEIFLPLRDFLSVIKTPLPLRGISPKGEKILWGLV